MAQLPNQQTPAPQETTVQQSRLKNIAAQMPFANQQLAAQQKAARDLQLLQAVQKAPTPSYVIPTAQQTGAAVAQQAGQEQIQRIQNAAQAQGQIAQMGQQLQAIQSQKEMAGLQAGFKEQQMSDAQRLANISEEAKQEMFDSRLSFQKDEMGRQFLNQRQLADYAALQAKNEQDWQNYVQRSEQLAARKELVLKAAQQKLVQQLQFENQQINQLRDQLSKGNLSTKELQNRRSILEQKLALDVQLKRQLGDLQAAQARAQARTGKTKAQNVAIASTVFAVVGGVVGGYFGGPQGAAAGALAGSQIGAGVGAMA